jgi:hypothetical protein
MVRARETSGLKIKTTTAQTRTSNQNQNQNQNQASLASAKEGPHLVCAHLGGHGVYFTNQNSPEMVSVLEKLAAKKQDTNHPI